ncbi:MAG: NAD-dependent epimerase/dehydratase family protein [Fidelibacterota bacterium]
MAILITGSSGYLGTELCRRFERESSVEQVIGVDLVPPRESFSKLTFYEKDCTGDLSSIFQTRPVDILIHLVFILDPIHDSQKMLRVNLGSLENVLSQVKTSGTRRVVVTSSYTAYGAHADNPPLLKEDHPLRGNEDFQYARDKTLVEEKLRRFGENNPGVEMIVVRPAVVVGAHMGNFISRYISKRWVPVVKDSGTEIQFLHEEDAAEALFRLSMEAPPGAYNVGPPDTLHPSEVARIMGGGTLALRPGLLRALTGFGWTFRLRFLSETPKSMIDFIQYPCVVDGTKIERETGFRYRYSSREAVEALAGRKNSG